MKEQNMYVCEACGSAYTNAEAAKKCEETHIGLANSILVQEFNKDYEYPLYLTVVGDDGIEIRYKYIGPEV